MGPGKVRITGNSDETKIAYTIYIVLLFSSNTNFGSVRKCHYCPIFLLRLKLLHFFTNSLILNPNKVIYMKLSYLMTKLEWKRGEEKNAGFNSCPILPTKRKGLNNQKLISKQLIFIESKLHCFRSRYFCLSVKILLNHIKNNCNIIYFFNWII